MRDPDGVYLSTTDEDIARAGKNPFFGAAPIRSSVPHGETRLAAAAPRFRCGNLRGIPDYPGSRQGGNLDPLTQASRAEGAVRAYQYTCWSARR